MAIARLNDYTRITAPYRLGGTILSDKLYFANSADSSLALPNCGSPEFRNIMP